MSRQDMLTELDADELALLAAFADEERPAAAARARVKARVLESAVPPVAAAPVAPVLRGPWVPWVAGAVLAAAAAALLVLTMSDSDVTAETDRGLLQAPDTPEGAQSLAAKQAVAPVPARSQPRTVATPTPHPTPVDPIDPGPDVVPEPALPQTLETPQAPAPRRRARANEEEPELEAPASASPSSLAEETRLLDRARQAVTSKQPAKALELLRDAERAFPHGVLRQERAALRVVALCDAGKVADGRTAAAAFLRAHPRSALRSRVQSACPESKP